MYDWKAEFRRYLVLPTQDLDQGGRFTIITGGAVYLNPHNGQLDWKRMVGGAQHNIDLLEVFVLKQAIESGRVTTPPHSYSMGFDTLCFIAAICDFHNIQHNFKPHRHYYGDYLDKWERIVSYLQAKYSEQPRPVGFKTIKTIHSNANAKHSLPLATKLFCVFLVIYLSLVMLGYGSEGLFVIVTAWYLAIIVLGFLIFQLLSIPARLNLQKPLARFVLRVLGVHSPPPH